MDRDTISINRAPVLTLWASVVAERLGFDRGAALTLGKALAGLNAQTKGRSLGIYKPAERSEGAPTKKARLGEELWIKILGRPVLAKRTEQGVGAVVKDRPIDPEDLEAKGFSLYERFRPRIPSGVRGWGVKGNLDLNLIRDLAKLK